MIERFQNSENGRRLLVDSLRKQHLVANDAIMAEALADVCTLRELRHSEVLIEQSGEDSDLFLILAGAFSIQVNSREIAVRNAGSHVGEMALIDPAAKRSASVIAKETSVVAQITEGAFSKIANNFPASWRCIAVELANRLRERSKFVKRPNDRAMIFIGSSSENVGIATEIKKQIHDESVEVKIWSEPGIFKLSKSALDSLLETAKAYDFSIMIFDENDVLETRNQTHFAPRDNVIFELGLFMGSIGSERSFIIRPQSIDLKIPSDLLGVTALTWDPKDLTASLAGQCAVLSQTIAKLGPK